MCLYKVLSFYQVAHALSRLDTANAMSIESGRREMLGRTMTSALGGMVSSAGGWLIQDAAVSNALDETMTDDEPPFASYQILPDASSNLAPTLQQITPSDLNKILAMTRTNKNGDGGGALWLGEHHNSAKDHQSLVQWDKRWSWSFEGYLPVFETCRELKIPLVALNVDSEDLGLVESGGFPNLPRERLQKYISDPAGFALFASSPYYKTYVDYVISPSYDMHQRMGILRSTITGQQLEEDMPFARFFSGRILWDEGMASNAYKWTKANRGLMIGLVGADHVKFNAGIPGRYQRMAADEQLGCISVILNPSLIDTRPSGSVSMMSNSAASASGASGLTLQLRYLKRGVDVGSFESRESSNTGGVLALADYIVISST